MGNHGASQGCHSIVENNSTRFGYHGASVAIDDVMNVNEVAKTKSNFPKQRLWLVDDDDDMRGLIAELIDRSESMDCAQQFYSAEGALDALAHELPPDIIVLDLHMGGMSGVDAIRPIKRLAKDTRVFIMTIFYDSIEAARARKAGASGFILKRDDWDEIVNLLCDRSSDWTSENAVIPVAEPRQPAAAVLPAMEYCRP
jgi:DNA-binding NtrC family response regulator